MKTSFGASYVQCRKFSLYEHRHKMLEFLQTAEKIVSFICSWLLVAIFFFCNYLIIKYELPHWLSGKESFCNAGDIGDTGSIPVSGRSPEKDLLRRNEKEDKERAAHFSTLAWEIPWTEKPGGLQTLGLRRVGYNLVTKQLNNCYFYI